MLHGMVAKRIAFILIAGAVAVSANVVSAQVTLDSINGSNTPIALGTWSASTYGIDYTPTSTYSVERIEANWNDVLADGRTITIEVFDGNPNFGGVKLTEGTFSQTAAGWQGADLNTPVDFVAGQDYFIGFSNTVGSMSRFFAADSSADIFTVWWGDVAGTYPTEDIGTSYHDPIWRFMGSLAAVNVPTLSSQGSAVLIILLAGFAVLIIRRQLVG